MVSEDRYRYYRATIKEAEVLAMPPGQVSTFLKERATSGWQNYEVDEDAEAALLQRNEPLINLSLAQHAKFIETLQKLFQIGEPSSPIRLAILSNTVVSGRPGEEFPVALFGTDDTNGTNEQAAAWMASASNQEVAALFENPNLGDWFLRDILNAHKPYDSVTDQQLLEIVYALSKNKRMSTPYDGDLDAMADGQYHLVFDAAWGLAERLPATHKFAQALSPFYENLCTDGGLKDPLAVAARWVLDPSDEDEVKEEVSTLQSGYLTPYQGVRKGLARLVLPSSTPNREFRWFRAHGLNEINNLAVLLKTFCSGNITC